MRINEKLFQMTIQLPWYAYIVNYLACGILPLELNYQQKRKLRIDARFYLWDNPLLFRRGADPITRICVLEVE